MKILIFGSKGFIGRSCVEYFSRNNFVTGCDVSEAEEADYNYFRIAGDDDIRKAIESEKFDICINASGSANVAFSFENPEIDYKLNVSNVQLMLNALKKSSQYCKFVNFSSASVYGNPASLPVTENLETIPLSPYGKHKLLAEEELFRFAQEGMRTCSLRVFSAYGPNLRKQLFWDIFRKSRANNLIRLFGTGTESRDFIYIDDLVDVLDLVIQSAPFKGEAVNVGTGIETTISAAAHTFISNLQNNFSLVFSGEEKKGDPVNWKADISKIKKMGFSPRISLEEGLRRTAFSYLQTEQVHGS